MTTQGPKFAVYDIGKHWLTDTCAGGSWSETVEEATWFDSYAEAEEALLAAEIVTSENVVVWQGHARYWPDLGITICRVR